MARFSQNLPWDLPQSLFSGLTERERQYLRLHAEQRRYPKNHPIAIEGLPVWGLIWLQHGTAKVYKLDKEGSEQIIRLVRPGELVGSKAVISGASYANHVTSLDEVVAWFIPTQVVWDLLEQNFAFCKGMLQHLAGELASVEVKLAHMAQLSVRERLAEVLLILQDRFGVKPDNQTLKLSLRRSDISYIIGADYRTTLRVLAELNQENIIRLKGRSITILDPVLLQQIAEGV